MTTLASKKNVFAEVFVLVIVASVCRFGQFTHGVSFVGASSTVILTTLILVREVVTVVVTTSPAFETVIAKDDGVVVVVLVSAGNGIIDGAYGGAVADENGFALYTGLFHITPLSVVTRPKVDAVFGNVSNKFFPSSVEFTTLECFVDAEAKETQSGVGFHDFVAVFVLDREVTVEGLSSVLVIVLRRAGKALIVEFNPVRTVFKCT